MIRSKYTHDSETIDNDKKRSAQKESIKFLGMHRYLY